MNVYAAKEQKNPLAGGKSSQRPTAVRSACPLADNCSETFQAKALQSLADNSPQVKRIRSMQTTADGNTAQLLSLKNPQARTDETISGNTTRQSPYLKAGFFRETGQAASRPGNQNVIQRIFDHQLRVQFDINWSNLSRRKAMDYLKDIARGKYSVSSDEMSRLMHKANVREHPVAIWKKRLNHRTRMKSFDEAENIREAMTNYVVPDHRQLLWIRKKQEEVRNSTGVALTSTQAWSLVLAEYRSRYNKSRYRAKALQRLQELNNKWQTNYTEQDMDRTLNYLTQEGLLATNYTFSRPPGANINCQVGNNRNLVDLLMESEAFKSLWETNASQASTIKALRGSVEESMGYGLPLRRVEGSPLIQDINTGEFDPTVPAEMPKYANLTPKHQIHGTPRYGQSLIYWKQAIKNRVTHTPGDSWNTGGQGATLSFTSPGDPESIFAYSDEMLLRMASAEATHQDQEFLERLRSSERGFDALSIYIETQIHGPLTWGDIEMIVIGEENDPGGLARQLREFAERKGHDFKVFMKSDKPTLTEYQLYDEFGDIEI